MPFYLGQKGLQHSKSLRRPIFTLAIGLLPLSISIIQAQKVTLPASLAAPNTSIIAVKTGLQYSEGPAIDSSGNLFFSEFLKPNHRIWKVAPGQEPQVWLAASQESNGLEFDPQNRLVACSKGRVLRYNSSAQVTDTLAPPPGSPTIGGEVNDLSFGPKGDFYFTNFVGGSVFYVSTSGNMTEFKLGDNPNGVEWIPEKGLVLVNQNGKNRVLAFSDGGGGKLENQKVFTQVAGPDGLTLDEQGNVYVASWSLKTVFVYDSTGKELGKIEVNAANVSNCVFGGPQGKTLFITGDGGCRKVELLVAGRKQYPKPVSIKNFRAHKAARSQQFTLSKQQAPRQNQRDVLGQKVGKGEKTLTLQPK